MTISVVPWINQEEFDTVYNWIFADRKQHLDLIQRGLDRVWNFLFFACVLLTHGIIRSKHGVIEE